LLFDVVEIVVDDDDEGAKLGELIIILFTRCLYIYYLKRRKKKRGEETNLKRFCYSSRFVSRRQVSGFRSLLFLINIMILCIHFGLLSIIYRVKYEYLKLEISVSSELNFARSQEEANATKCKTNII
jgi:hypothetical protein